MIYGSKTTGEYVAPSTQEHPVCTKAVNCNYI